MNEMNENIRNEIEALESMRLPDLQARFAEVVGEPTRAPNRVYLVRRITEALEAQVAEASVGEPEPDEAQVEPADEAPTAAQGVSPAPAADSAEADEEAPEAADSAPEAALDEPAATAARPQMVARKLTKMDVDALRARYVEVVGRPTSSTNKAYLVWKIRQAEQGKIPVGPRESRRTGGEPKDIKVLPLRMETELVVQLDQARERLGLKSRMDLFRRALNTFLGQQGEADVAALFALTVTEASEAPEA